MEQKKIHRDDIRNLDVFRYSSKFLELAQEIISQLPRGTGDLKNQFDRASTSILLNISEGGGKWSVPDKKRCYQIAKGEATECIGLLEVFKIRKLCRKEYIREGFELLERIVAMLTRMCKR